MKSFTALGKVSFRWWKILTCQKPPIIDGWHILLRNTHNWFLTLNIPIEPLITNEWNIVVLIYFRLSESFSWHSGRLLSSQNLFFISSDGCIPVNLSLLLTKKDGNVVIPSSLPRLFSSSAETTCFE